MPHLCHMLLAYPSHTSCLPEDGASGPSEATVGRAVREVTSISFASSTAFYLARRPADGSRLADTQATHPTNAEHVQPGKWLIECADAHEECNCPEKLRAPKAPRQ
eukprot:scaffold16743_cov129-Isochrysis_galbana.AAC.1